MVRVIGQSARGSLALSAALASAVLAVGCGSNDGSSGATSETGGAAQTEGATAGAAGTAPHAATEGPSASNGGASAGGSSGGASSSAPATTVTQGGSAASSGGATTTGTTGTGGASVAMPAAGGASGVAGAPASAGGASTSGTTIGALFWLDIAGNRVLRANEDGTAMKAIVTGQGVAAPDGVAVDVAAGKVYWTNMGVLTDAPHTPSGSLQRANLDGTGVEVIVAPGATNTPKQMQVDAEHHKIYWADREGAKAWRANMDGSLAEVILEGHGIQQLVGMALDVAGGKFYVTDRYAKTISRAAMELPAGATASTRQDVETLVVTTGASMPIDLDLDVAHHMMYWTDRGIGTVMRAGMELPAGATAMSRADVTTLMKSLATPIGISLDLTAGKLYVTEIAGRLYEASLDGTGMRAIGSGGSGVTHVALPTK